MMESPMRTMLESYGIFLMALTSDQLSPPIMAMANLLCENLTSYSTLKTVHNIYPKTSLSMVWEWRGSERILQKRGTTSSTIEVYLFKCMPVDSIRFYAIFCWSLVIVFVLLVRDPS